MLEKIEQELKIELPDTYKEVILNNPFSNKTEYNFVHTCLLDEADEILKINEEIRFKGYQGQKWPPHYYIFGYYKKGGYLFINTKSKKSGTIFLITSEEIFNPIKIGHLKHFSDFGKLIKNARILQKASSNK